MVRDDGQLGQTNRKATQSDRLHQETNGVVVSRQRQAKHLEGMHVRTTHQLYGFWQRLVRVCVRCVEHTEVVSMLLRESPSQCQVEVSFAILLCHVLIYIVQVCNNVGISWGLIVNDLQTIPQLSTGSHHQWSTNNTTTINRVSSSMIFKQYHNDQLGSHHQWSTNNTTTINRVSSVFILSTLLVKPIIAHFWLIPQISTQALTQRNMVSTHCDPA